MGLGKSMGGICKIFNNTDTFFKILQKYKQNEEWEGYAFLFLFHLWEGRLRL